MRPAPSSVPTFAMAAACGIGVANIYYNQPMLALIEHGFPASPAASLIPTATQLGYAAGLLLLVPLGDLLERRRVIVAQFLVLGLALAAAAIAPTAMSLVAASLLVGAASSVAQQVVPFAATLAAPEKRGRTIGTVMSGLLCGILLSRTLAGFVATHLGWREMFWIGVPLALSGATLMALTLPRSPAAMGLGYGAALKSLAYLWRAETALRRATLAQAALFASFSVFWTILALRLEEPVFRLGADVAGLFGILGLVGILAAPIAGYIADRHGSHAGIALGAALALSSWAAFGLWDTIAGLVLGVVLLDFGVQSSLISNQHVIFALRPEARSRLNTVFTAVMFIGGGIGSAGAMLIYHLEGWSWLCVYGAALAAAALLPQIGGRGGN